MLKEYSFNGPVYLLISDLNYNGKDTARIITRREFYRVKRWDGRYLKRRCTRAKYEEIERGEFREKYDLAIMKKYNVGPDYSQNRYFMEQVRPTLY